MASTARAAINDLFFIFINSSAPDDSSILPCFTDTLRMIFICIYFYTNRFFIDK
ncbi:hypothetical protein ANACAC_03399 [Anaerostipes caccae L1-92]|uniref:Uncharacterized protein n=1 Tax=Anaerostipes caccae (strain DSM 14662 / CCUG 47493 / JCM 13470 / NCIMB 13811 / L1-92) TaxID=411490 RepID=B0MIE6_ANACD|nr:hypothetical protein ANACAC_03399 [Anaerostipes caccae L1-92]